MRLKLKKGSCTGCGNCLKSCPNRLGSLKAMACDHCKVEEAKCLMACKHNAVYEVSEGILTVDRERCRGCRECAGACEKNAIQFVKGKAAKCDLCAKNDFMISCARDCQLSAIELRNSYQELREIGKIMGWRVFRVEDGEIKRTHRETGFSQVVETREGKMLYRLKEFPELTLQEAKLISRVVEEFREQNREKGKEKILAESLAGYCRKKSIVLDREQQDYLVGMLDCITFGCGPLTELLKDDALEELTVTGLGRGKPVYVFDRAWGWIETNIFFTKTETVRNLVNKMARQAGRRLTMQSPRINAVLSDGSRMNAALPPVSFSGPNLTIRKFRSTPFKAVELVENRTISAEALSFLSMALQTDCSMLICGNTGSGKTTTLNALFEFVPATERVIIVEETPELNIAQSHQVKLNVVENLGVGMDCLITDSLRMRPDRVVVGEVRNGEEVSAFIDTVLAGQGKGSYSTFHAQSAEEAVSRLRKLGVMEIDLASVDLFVVQKRWNRIDLERGTAREVRRVVELSEPVLRGGKPKLNRLFGFDHENDLLRRESQGKSVRERIMRCFGLDAKGLEKELAKRTRLLKEGKGLDCRTERKDRLLEDEKGLEQGGSGEGLVEKGQGSGGGEGIVWPGGARYDS